MESILAPRLDALQLALMAAALLVANELFYRLGRRRPEALRDAKKSQADVVVAALLALLGLLLAFSFEIGESRFARRKDLVLEEANAIATTYLRADMLPAPDDERMHTLLREYVGYRIGIKTPEELERAIAHSAVLHAQMWAEATSVARANASSPIVALFVASLNNLIDLHEARVTVALFQRIPPAIFDILFLVSLLSIGMVGFRAGIDRARGLLSAFVLVAVIMSVIGLIRALDEPTSRLFNVSKHAIRDTQKLMERNPTPPSALVDPR